jgi:hypothetical protein
MGKLVYPTHMLPHRHLDWCHREQPALEGTYC